MLESLTLAAFCGTFPHGRHNSISFPTPACSNSVSSCAPRSGGGGEGEGKCGIEGGPIIVFLLRDVKKRITIA